MTEQKQTTDADFVRSFSVKNSPMFGSEDIDREVRIERIAKRLVAAEKMAEALRGIADKH